MKTRLYIFSMIVLICLLSLAGCQAPQAALADSISGLEVQAPHEVQTPAEVAQNFYENYLAYFNGPDGQFRSPLGDQVYRESPYVTEKFVRQVDEVLASFDGKGGYDPILCAQNIPMEIKVDSVFTSGDNANVLMHTDLLPDHAFNLELVNQDSVWRIDRVTCTFTPAETAKAFYTQYLGYITAGSGDGRSPDGMRNSMVDGTYRQSPFLSQAFIEKVDGILGSFEKGGYDPFLMAQDIPQSFDVTAGPDENSAIVSEQFGPNSSIEVLVAMKMENGRWLIEDISRYEDAGDSTGNLSIEGWQIYQDAEYGFSINYPGGWVLHELDLSQGPQPSDWPVKRHILLVPSEIVDQVLTPPRSLEEANSRILVAPFSIQVIVGDQEAFARSFAQPLTSWQKIYNGYDASVRWNDPGYIHYVFQHPEDPNLRIVVEDMVGKFPGRQEQAKAVVGVLELMLSTISFSQ